MKKKLWERRGGVNRAVAILLVLMGVLFVLIAIPAWKAFQYRAEKIGCDQGMKTAKDGLIIEFLYRWDTGSTENAMETLDEVMPGRTDICPTHGEVYLVRRADGIFETFCGKHDSDHKRRARLNATRAMDLLLEGLRKERRVVEEEPESITIQINGAPLECVRVQQEEDIHRGTKTTDGYEGIVAFYGLAGEGDFAVTDEAPAGEVCYFVYADEEYCGIWRAGDGWTGTAYTD